MTMRQTVRVAQRGSAPYLAGEYLHKNGPQSQADLFTAIDFGSKPSRREEALQRALVSGWLTATVEGKIACSFFAKAYYEERDEEPSAKAIGQITPAQYRPSVFASQGLSKKNIPSARGTRSDIPDWSVREKPSLKSIAGGDA